MVSAHVARIRGLVDTLLGLCMPIVTWILGALAIYLLIGLCVGVLFAARLAARLDPGTRGSSLAVRLFLVPGAIALWPVVLGKLWNQPGGDHS